MKGRVIPVFGMALHATAILRIACNAICAMTPITRKEPKRSFAFFAISYKRYRMSA
jgi:hypothetical protein